MSARPERLYTPRTIEITTPDRLSAGQNLLDQRPFSDVLPQVAEQHGVSIDVLRKSYVTGETAHATAAAEQQLQVYPHLRDYVAETLATGRFEEDGTPKPGQGERTPTYAPSLVDRLDRERRIQGLTIRGVIFDHESPEEAARRAKAGIFEKTWTITALM